MGPPEVISSFTTSSKGRIKYKQMISEWCFSHLFLKTSNDFIAPKIYFSILTARKFPLLSNLHISPLPCMSTTSSPTYHKKLMSLLFYSFPVCANVFWRTWGFTTMERGGPCHPTSFTPHHPGSTTGHICVLLPHASPQPMHLKQQKDVKMQASP